MSKILKFDAIVVGSGFDALFTAYSLQSQGQKVAVIEKEDDVGGLYRCVKNGEAQMEAHLNFIPKNSITESMLEVIQRAIPDLTFETLNLGPLTFQNGQVQPFLGFGSTEIQAMDEYTIFTQPEQFKLSCGLGELSQKIRQTLTCQILTQSEITALESEPELAITINGSQKITASHIYFFENSHKLSKLLSAGTHSAPKNFVQRLSKTPLWTAVNLTFHHSQSLTESEALHVLYGAKEQPCLGRFRHIGDVMSSQWSTFVSQEVAADSELLGATIREMKKQIKRMYPQFFEAIAKEFILISPEAYGVLTQKIIENGIVPKMPQIHVGSRFYVETPGVGGDLAALATVLGSQSPQETVQEASLT